MVNFNSFGARTILQYLVKICRFDPCYLANFWRIYEWIFAYSINLDLNFHIKSILVVKMHPMCLKSTPNTPHFDLFFRFFNAVFGDPDLCYNCPSVGGLTPQNPL